MPENDNKTKKNRIHKKSQEISLAATLRHDYNTTSRKLQFFYFTEYSSFANYNFTKN